MAATTHARFGANTEAIDVAKGFAAQIRGKTVLVTGVNRNGIGFSTAQALASQSPAHLVIAGRSQQKILECIDALKIEFSDVNYHGLRVDLSSQQSVRAAATEVLAWHDMPVVDIIVNSAGVMGIQERILNEDGIEMHFATNHIGHWLLTCLLMPKLIKAAESNPKGATRVVNVSANPHKGAGIRWSDINFDQKNENLPESEQPNYDWFKAWGYTDMGKVAYNPLDGYVRSKVANILFGIGANERLFQKYGIVALAVHPGVIATDLGRNFPVETIKAIEAAKDAGHISTKTLGAGASTSLVAALDPKLGQGVGETKNGSKYWGSFLADCQISDRISTLAISNKEAEKLWELSEKLVGQKFAW